RIPTVVSHGERVANYAIAVARELGIARTAWQSIKQAARFHDIGKAAIPASLLTKPAPLTPAEIAIMQWHVHAGAAILQATRSLSDVAPIVRASHEWFGGEGYPDRLDGDRIPLASRIIAVVDAYDAMTEDRCYRARLDPRRAVAEL